MPLTRQIKEQRVSQMEQDIASASGVVFFAFDALTMEDVNELRDKLQEEGSRLRVMPKRLLRLVMQNTKLDFDPLIPEGQIAVIWGSDTSAPARVLYEFAKARENVRLLAGTLEGSFLSAQEVTSLAQLPSRHELFGQLVGVLSGPMRALAATLAGVPRQAVYVLQAIADQKQDSQ